MADTWPEIPPVSFDADLERIGLGKLRTIQKQRKAGTFPIPELLPRLDKRHRYSRADVVAYLERRSTRASSGVVPIRRRG